MQWISSKPLKLMGGSLLLKLVVPIIAHLAGNVDPNENAISHAFGQSSLCVAMDFPGWYEAALVVFLVAGLMDEYALFAVWWHFKEEWKASRGKVLGLHVLMVFLALCFGCFFMVSFWNPAASHDSNTVVAHTIPYLGLQLGYFTLALFVCLALPIEASTCQKVSLYVSLFLYLLLQVANLVVILWTFAELSEQGQVNGSYKGPKARVSFLRSFEPLTILGVFVVLVLHPLTLAKAVLPEESKAVETEQP